jgi:hypothetical protein
MKLKAGTLDDFDDSMAKAMEHAFETIWLEQKGCALSEASRDDRRMLFAAVAQGVVKHLQTTASATFQVDVTVEHTGSSSTSVGEGTVALNTEGDLY